MKFVNWYRSRRGSAKTGTADFWVGHFWKCDHPNETGVRIGLRSATGEKLDLDLSRKEADRLIAELAESTAKIDELDAEFAA